MIHSKSVRLTLPQHQNSKHRNNLKYYHDCSNAERATVAAGR